MLEKGVAVHTVPVSIGIPFLNARPYLADAVRSVFAQTHEDWELTLIDDGSTDGSLELVRNIDDRRVRVFSDGSRRGLCARLNQIADLAQGKYLARMDADDLMHPERIARQLAFLEASPAIDVLDTAAITVDENSTPLGIRGEVQFNADPRSVLCHGLLIHPTVMGKAEWFRTNRYDPTYVRAEDRELWCRTCTHTRFARIVEPLFFYRESLKGNLRNYLHSEATVRQILQRYGPPVIGNMKTKIFIARSWLKSACYYLGTLAGTQGRLIAGRNRTLNAAEIENAVNTMVKIRKTVVPGLTDSAVREEVLT